MWPGALLVPLPSAAALSGEHIKSAPHCVCDAAAAALAVLSLSRLARSLRCCLTTPAAPISCHARAPQRCARRRTRKMRPENWSKLFRALRLYDAARRPSVMTRARPVVLRCTCALARWRRARISCRSGHNAFQPGELICGGQNCQEFSWCRRQFDIWAAHFLAPPSCFGASLCT